MNSYNFNQAGLDIFFLDLGELITGERSRFYLLRIVYIISKEQYNCPREIARCCPR
jgi:hypothetical protein